MGSAVIFLLCIGFAALGAWHSAKCKHRKIGKLPEDIQ